MALQSLARGPVVRDLTKRLLECRLLFVFAGSLTFCAVIPLCKAAPPQDRVLVLSASAETSDSQAIERLRLTLAQAGLDASRVGIVRRSLPALGAEQQPRIKQALAQVQPRVVVALSMTIARGVQLIDSRVPIVFDGAADPLRMCLVDNLVRPGRNATGFTSHLVVEAKMLEALSDAYPRLRRVVVLVSGNEPHLASCSAVAVTQETSTTCIAGEMRPRTEPDGLLPLRAMRELAELRGIDLTFVELCTLKDISLVRAAALRSDTGFVVPLHYLFYLNRSALIKEFASAKAPAIYARRYFVSEGGLLALVPKQAGPMSKRAFELVPRILSGSRPADLPVERPNGFDLYVNLRAIDDPALRPTLGTLRRADHLVR